MAKGISLHIGLNTVDPGHYAGWSGELVAAENDAKDMKTLATREEFHSSIMLTAKATRKAVREAIEQAATKLSSGDIFLLTYSGHGGQLPDRNGDEPDGKDETWCLYDGQLVDDELYDLWHLFVPGVRIVVISDSCHSGSVIKAMFGSATSALLADILPRGIARSMPRSVANRVYYENHSSYDDILSLEPKPKDTIRASVLLISGCQDNQESFDGTFNGEFTRVLLDTWRNGKFVGNYRDFQRAIQRQLPPTQSPNLMLVGTYSQATVAQRPFAIQEGSK